MRFGDLSIHPALAAALAGRGYETATPVQAAVVGADHTRDLLVSSQTGSGKTVAFGTALAATLLGAEPKIKHGPSPVALVIAPTRELATQVREELRWLLHGTGIRLASVTGGTPIGGDLKTLQRGVELLIGTPGRLVDLLRREHPDGVVRRFDFKALSPLFDLHPFTVCGRPDGDKRFALWARSAEGALAMQATAEIA